MKPKEEEKLIPTEPKTVYYKKTFNEVGEQLEKTERMMERAIEDAKKLGYEKISVKQDRPGAWEVMFYL